MLKFVNYISLSFQMVANMFFTKVILSKMNFVENFADFLIDVEMNNLPLLKRVCEGYLCSELDSVSFVIPNLHNEYFFAIETFLDNYDFQLKKKKILDNINVEKKKKKEIKMSNS